MIRAVYSDKHLVVEILTKSFSTNKSVNYIVKQDDKRQKRVAALMDYSFDMCFYYGEVFLSDNRKACALVLYPDKKRTTLRTILWDAKLIFSCVGAGGINRTLDREAKVKSFHPKEPFYYLWFIGVDPDYQRKGIGSSLLAEILRHSELQKRDVYLETSVLENLPWYQQFGFEIFNELEFTYKLYLLRKRASVFNK